MDCRVAAVIIFLCLAVAACRPVKHEKKTRALKETIPIMQELIQASLRQLAEPELLLNISCLSLNTTGLVGLEQQPLTAQHLSSFGCLLQKVSESAPITELSEKLNKIIQPTRSIERLMNITRQDCSLPHFEQKMDSYLFVKCLLELLDQQLSKATF